MCVYVGFVLYNCLMRLHLQFIPTLMLTPTDNLSTPPPPFSQSGSGHLGELRMCVNINLGVV